MGIDDYKKEQRKNESKPEGIVYAIVLIVTFVLMGYMFFTA